VKRAPQLAQPADLPPVDRAYRETRGRILDGHYRPGAPLSELRLAETYGMSRTPVREALSRLHQEGWVERIPSRGYFVARVTLRAIHDSFEVRRLLEGAAAAAAARVATAAEIDELARLVAAEAALNPTSLAATSSANRQFHLAIAAASHNQLAAELIAHCMATMDRVLALGVNALPLMRGTSDEHQAIVDAISRRDADRAKQAMEEHLDRCAQLLRDALYQGALNDLSA
jgi:DNA-binding GntR family transcriptional regulator